MNLSTKTTRHNRARSNFDQENSTRQKCNYLIKYKSNKKSWIKRIWLNSVSKHDGNN
jgi:hypothetical protein